MIFSTKKWINGILICFVRIKICINQMYSTINVSIKNSLHYKTSSQNTYGLSCLLSEYLRVCTEQSESESAMSASFLIRVTLRPLNAGITITSGQWMSQTQTKDMGHHRLRLRSVQKYFAYFCVLANES